MISRRVGTGLSLVIVALLALPSCNSSSPSSSNPPSGGGGTPVQNASVSANGNNTFTPSQVLLLIGGTVSFSNSSGLHNVNATGAADFRCANGCDGEGGDGDPSTASWSFSRTFNAAGTVSYVCDEHAGVGMAGSIVVQ